MTVEERWSFTPDSILYLDSQLDLEGLRKLVTGLPTRVTKTYIGSITSESYGASPLSQVYDDDDWQLSHSLTPGDPPLSCPYNGSFAHVMEYITSF